MPCHANTLFPFKSETTKALIIIGGTEAHIGFCGSMVNDVVVASNAFVKEQKVNITALTGGFPFIEILYGRFKPR